MTNFSADVNKELWDRFRRGDRISFETIYRSRIADLLNYGYKVTSDRALIEDSIQDLFYELWQSRENLSQTTSIKYYLFRALRNKIMRNGNVKTVDFNDLPETADVTSEEFLYENYLIEIENQTLQAQKLKGLISKLPKRQQEAINLRYYHNFSNEEIAGIMDVNYQSACKFMYTALKSLRIDLKHSALTFISALAMACW